MHFTKFENFSKKFQTSRFNSFGRSSIDTVMELLFVIDICHYDFTLIKLAHICFYADESGTPFPILAALVHLYCSQFDLFSRSSCTYGLYLRH